MRIKKKKEGQPIASCTYASLNEYIYTRQTRALHIAEPALLRGNVTKRLADQIKENAKRYNLNVLDSLRMKSKYQVKFKINCHLFYPKFLSFRI